MACYTLKFEPVNFIHLLGFEFSKEIPPSSELWWRGHGARSCW